MWTLRAPSPDRIRAFLEEQEGAGLSYPEAGRTRRMPGEEPPAGYDVDHECGLLGVGRSAWLAACDAVCAWEMFPSPLTRVAYPSGDRPPVAEGTTVAMVVHAFGVWWVNACRVVYSIDEGADTGAVKRRFGFAYGTLPGHVERGEERFLVEWRADDTVRYDLLAFSRPRAWVVRVGYPFARALQKRFRVESFAAMRRAVARRIPDAAPTEDA